MKAILYWLSCLQKYSAENTFFPDTQTSKPRMEGISNFFVFSWHPTPSITEPAKVPLPVKTLWQMIFLERKKGTESWKAKDEERTYTNKESRLFPRARWLKKMFGLTWAAKLQGCLDRNPSSATCQQLRQSFRDWPFRKNVSHSCILGI